jgi:hypothetical protein
LVSQFTPLDLSRNSLWQFWNKSHLVTKKPLHLEIIS